ncbi:MAG: MBOAT family O-acyltransferase [Chthoniobacterales bacterium]
MLFNTVEYWLFFAAVLVIFYNLPFRYGKVFLLIASYLFYMDWSAQCVLLIIASTLVDYTLGRFLESAKGQRKKRLVAISIFVNLGFLGFFKYYNLFAGSVAVLAGRPENSFALNIILPVGISFYTFASLSYIVDVYKGRMKAERNLVDYAFFVTFFPHLLAGPIIRARQFLSQIATWQRPSSFVVQSGIVLILSGLVKKMIFADRFAIVANDYFAQSASFPGWLAAWSALFAVYMQIFFDFSGYTDIARGCARLLGFEFPLNFVRPMLASNPIQFWQRWHISLTTWIRDYVFKPLIARRKGWFLFARSTLITMLLIGLWHGAGWHFVLWGGYSGVMLVLYRVYKRATEGTMWEKVTRSRLYLPFALVIGFATVTASFALFRTQTLHEAAGLFQVMFHFQGAAGASVLTSGLYALSLISFLLAVLEERHLVIQRLATAPAWIQIPSYTCVFLALELFSITEQKVPFIYFQF